jgi:hypothetical protein
VYEIKQDITEDLVLSYLSEKQIMEHYLGIPVIFNRLLKSPLRYDKKPTVSFYTDNSGYLRYHDFGTGDHLHCFGVIMKKFGISYYDALERCYNELIEGKEIPIIPQEQRIEHERVKKQLDVKRRKFTQEDLEWWGQFGISQKTLEFYKVTGLQTLWINGKIVYAKSSSDPGYLYDFDSGIYKAYFPYRTEYRFMSNTSSFILQGYLQLPKKGKVLIITKALKDVMTLYELGYTAIAPQAESVLISANQMIELKSRFKKIVSFMDFDYTGVRLMNKMKKLYGIPPYTLTNGRFYTPDYGAKDISDLVKKLGKEEVKKLIEEK